MRWDMALRRNTADEDSRKFWEFVDEAAQRATQEEKRVMDALQDSRGGAGQQSASSAQSKDRQMFV